MSETDTRAGARHRWGNRFMAVALVSFALANLGFFIFDGHHVLSLVAAAFCAYAATTTRITS